MSYLSYFNNFHCVKIACSLCNVRNTLTSIKVLKRFYDIKPVNLNIDKTFLGISKVGTVNSSRNNINTSLTSARLCKILHRSYAKQRKPAHSDSESSDDEDLDPVDKYDKSCKIIKSRMASLRLDSVLKAALNMARNKVDVAFYESKIRVNGEKVLKKSQRVNVGDEIDIIKGISPLNPNFLNIARVEIISVKADEDDEEIIVKMRRYKSMQIENYESAPYKQRESS